MVHHKLFEIEDLSMKYGHPMVGYVAHEDISKGEKIFSCDEENCMYKDSETRFTRAEIDQLLKESPEKKDYIYRYSIERDGIKEEK